jgi:ubiquinone/menaquinone biosynthesis C-methylase UbiE
MSDIMTIEKEFIPALGFQWLSGIYDLIFRIFLPEKKLRGRLAEELNPKDGDEILEFGYGTGQNLVVVYARNKNIRLSGIDIDPAIRQIAAHRIKRKNIPVALELYDGKTFPFPDNSFDKIYSCLVFHHLAAVSKLHCLKEMNRILKPGGQLVICDWGRARSGLMRFVYYSVQLLDGFRTTEDNVKGLIPRFMGEADFANIKESGFINTAIGTLSYYCAAKRSVAF